MSNVAVEEVKRGLVRPTGKDLLVIEEENIFVFFSVDICNSTKLKNQNEYWFEANRCLYNVQFTFMQFWKYNGDEVLYAEPFAGLSVLADIIKKAYTYIKQLQNEISNRIEDPTFQLKGTIWLAHTNTTDSKPDPNLHIKYSDRIHEFLGNNIDEGFRLAKNISGSKIALDPKIIYLFLLSHDIYKGNGKCKIVDEDHSFYKLARNISSNDDKTIEEILIKSRFINYTALKGVWSGRGYPIFWYYEGDKDFLYDERIDDTYIISPTSVMDSRSSWSTKIEQIYSGIGKKSEFLQLLEAIAEEKYGTSYSLQSTARLYYTIACINPSTKNLLIAQRSTCRKHLKNVWEFFPFKHTTKEVVGSIEKLFKDQYGLEISIVTDQEKEQNILPLHFCTIYRNGQAHNSLLCMATLKEPDSDENIIKKIKGHADGERYSDFRFINPEGAKTFKPIDIDEIKNDSLAALSDAATKFEGDRCAMYLEQSVLAVAAKYSEIEDGWTWYNVQKKERV